MNISSLYGSLASTATSNVAATSATQAVSPGGSIPAAPPGAGSASISTPGQFFSEMQQLSQSNPTEFKAVAAQVATTFQNAASQASGPQAKALNNLATQFSQAAQTGTLQPPQGAQAAAQSQNAGAGSGSSGGGHHHHHHHGGGGMGQSGPVQQAFDSAMSILTQAQQGGGSIATSSASSSTRTT